MRGTKVTLLDGKERVLRFDLNAIAEIGDRLGIEVRPSFIREDLLDRALPLSAIRTVLFCGLMHDKDQNPETEEEIGKLADLQSLPSIVSDFFAHFSVTALQDLPGNGVPERTTRSEGRKETAGVG